MKKQFILAFMIIGCGKPEPEKVSVSPVPLPVHSSPHTAVEAAPYVPGRIDSINRTVEEILGTTELIKKEYNDSVKQEKEQIKEQTKEKVEVKPPGPTPPSPGQSSSPRSGEPSKPEKSWYRIQGHPGLWGWGRLIQKPSGPEIVDIDRWHQDPSYPVW